MRRCTFESRSWHFSDAYQTFIPSLAAFLILNVIKIKHWIIGSWYLEWLPNLQLLTRIFIYSGFFPNNLIVVPSVLVSLCTKTGAVKELLQPGLQALIQFLTSCHFEQTMDSSSSASHQTLWRSISTLHSQWSIKRWWIRMMMMTNGYFFSVVVMYVVISITADSNV